MSTIQKGVTDRHTEREIIVMIMIEYRVTEVYDLTAAALGAWRPFHAAANAAREDLPPTVRSVLNSYLATAPDVLFSAKSLSTGDALLDALRAAVERVGGAPVLSQTEDGAPNTIGGTEVGGRIATAADRLAKFLPLAWQVHDALTAERVIAAQRAALEKGRTGSAEPGPDVDSPA